MSFFDRQNYLLSGDDRTSVVENPLYPSNTLALASFREQYKRNKTVKRRQFDVKILEAFTLFSWAEAAVSHITR